MFPCSLSVVTIMSDISRSSSRVRTVLMNVSPSITGMFQSTSATSGRSPASSWSRASWPSPACATSNPSCVMSRARIDRMARESSTTRACMGPPSASGVGGGSGSGFSGGHGGAPVRADVEDAAGVEREEQPVGKGVGAQEQVPDTLVDGARRLLERHLRHLEDAADLVDEQADRLVVDADDDVDRLAAA